MSISVREFETFHHSLTSGRAGFVPFYFVLEPGGKKPFTALGSWKEKRVTFEEAGRWLQSGYNVGLAATANDPLVIIDVDKEGAIVDVKPTLCVRTRKRTGRHYFYFTNDPRCKVNIPSPEHVGEVRANWQYVVVAGSFVRTDVSKLEAPPSEDQEKYLGMYTIEEDLTVSTITYEELPEVFRRATESQKQATPRESKKREPESPESKLWSLTIEDVIGEHPSTNFPSPFHESETGANTTVSNGLLHCWRHSVSMTPLHALAVKAGLLDCTAAGDGHKGTTVGPSVIDFKDKKFVLQLWEFAKKNGILPDDDPNPFGEDKRKKPKGKKTPERCELPKMSDDVWQQIKDVPLDEIEVVASPFIHLKDGTVAMEILSADGIPRFAVRDVQGSISIAERMTGEHGEVIIPLWDASVGHRFGISLPSKPLPFDSVPALYGRMLEFCLSYYDPVDEEGLRCMKLDLLYVLMSGFQEQNISYWPIINPRGQSETGKGRLAFLLYLLSCRGMWEAKPKIGTLHRSVNDWKPTLCLDEMDLKDSSESSDLVQFLNCRSTGALYRRYSTESGRVEISDVTGPTIACTRSPFQDDGLESRCIVQPGKSGRNMGRDEAGKKLVPYLLPPEAFDEALVIRNTLLTFWLTKYGRYEIDYYGPKDSQLTHRLQAAFLEIGEMAKMVGLESEVKQIMEELSRDMVIHRGEKPEGKLVQALHLMWTDRAFGRPVKSGSTRFPWTEGYYAIDLVVGSGVTESSRLATVTDLARVAQERFELFGVTKGQRDPSKPMSAVTIGRKFAKQLYIQVGGGGREGRSLFIRPRDLEGDCRKFVPDYEKGSVLQACNSLEEFGTNETVGTHELRSLTPCEDIEEQGSQRGDLSSLSQDSTSHAKIIPCRPPSSLVPSVTSVPEEQSVPSVPIDRKDQQEPASSKARKLVSVKPRGAPRSTSSPPHANVTTDATDATTLQEELLLSDAAREEGRLQNVVGPSWSFVSALVDDAAQAIRQDTIAKWGAFHIRTFAIRFEPAPSQTIVDMLANDVEGYQRAIKVIARARIIKASKLGGAGS